MVQRKRGKNKVDLFFIQFLPFDDFDLTTIEYKASAHWLPTNRIRAAYSLECISAID